MYTCNVSETFYSLYFFIQSGIILIDTPGIGEHESVDQVLWDCIQEFDICACIYIVKSDNGTGVYPDRVSLIYCVYILNSHTHLHP